MLKIKLTENYTGITISGDFNDLDFLYDSVSYLIKHDNVSDGECVMQNHLYAFLYDLRHAYEGKRDAILINNNLNNNSRMWFEFKKKDVTNNNVYFCFNYLLPDLLLDIILVKYFIRKINKKDNNIFNSYINMVNYFYSVALNSLRDMLAETKFNKLKKELLRSVISDSDFIPRWFEIINCDYINMTKIQREKKFMQIMDAIYNYDEYEDYIKIKMECEKICKEVNCSLDDLHYENYPNDDEIVW